MEVPTARWPLSREASLAVHLTPLVTREGARYGLSLVSWGAVSRPECSPVTSSLLSSVMWCAAAQSRLFLIWPVMVAWSTQTVLPPASLVHFQGTTETSCRQPRYGCV